MRRLVSIVAAILGAVVVMSVINGQMQTGIGTNTGAANAAAPTSSSSDLTADLAAAPKISSLEATTATTSIPAVSSEDAAAVGDDAADATGATNQSAGSDDVQVSPGGSAIVYRLSANAAVANGGRLDLYGVGAAMTSTSGTTRQSTKQFFTKWSGDPMASSLPGVLLTTDGVRHVVTLTAPSYDAGRVTFVATPATTVPAGIATETGISTSGAVAGISGTVTHPVLFVALAAGRTVRGCQLVPGATCDGKDLSRVVLTSAQLAGASLRSAKLWQSVLHDADLTRADLTHLHAFRADLSGATARGAIGAYLDLTQGSATDADFSNASLDHAKFYRSDISGARFDEAQLLHFQGANLFAKGASFAGANLVGAQFPKADLTDVDFRGADLRGVNFDRANLTGVDFSGADLTGADLNRATITRASFAGAVMGNTECPDGLLHTYSHC